MVALTICFNKPSRRLWYMLILRPSIPGLSVGPQGERNIEYLQVGGTKCLPLTNSRCKCNEESGELKAKGVWEEYIEGKNQGKLKNGYCNISYNPRGQTVHAVLWITHQHFPHALFLIGFTVQIAEVCFDFFPQKFQTATLKAMGCLEAVLCFPGFQLSIETPHLPTYFYRKPI